MRSEAAAVALLTLLLAACSRQPQAGSAEAVAMIQVRKPNRIERPMFLGASGTVEAAETAKVAFQVAGQAARVLVEEGDFVRAGQPLAELDPRDYEIRVKAAAAQVAAARAAAAKADSAVRKQELAQAKVDCDRLADEYGRYKQLYERKSIAPAEFKKIEAAYLAAKERYSLAQEGARPEDKQAAHEGLRAALAQEEAAHKALADTKLISPIDGLVARRELDSGDPVGTGRPVFIIMNLNPVKVRVGVPEAEIGRVKRGQQAAVLIPSLGEKKFNGRVESVGIAADPMSRTFAVKISVPNPVLELRAGMIAESRIQAQGVVRAMTVPAQAVVRDPQGAVTVFVFFADRKRVYSRRVDVGTVYDREIEVVRGLEGEELVVVSGQQGLVEGSLASAEVPE